MASEHLIKDGEDWNYIFVARDFDGNEDQPSKEDSDSDSDYLGEDRETQSDQDLTKRIVLETHLWRGQNPLEYIIKKVLRAVDYTQ